MIATSIVVMLVLMYLNTYQLDHVFVSQTRAYMALVMGAAMAVIMLAFMQGMYKNHRLNIGIFIGKHSGLRDLSAILVHGNWQTASSSPNAGRSTR